MRDRTRTPFTEAREGAFLMLPIAVAALPFGLLLGAQAAEKGLSPLEMLAMSSIVFAGSSQFLAVTLWTDPAPVVGVALAAFLINLRHLLMGASLAPKLGRFEGLRRFLAVHLMADEVWALAEQRALKEPLSPAFYFGAGTVLFVSWQASTVLGTVFGGLVAEPERYGFDFAFPAIFIALVIGFWRGLRTTGPVIAAAAVAAVAVHAVLPGAWYVLAGAFAGILAAVVTAPADTPGEARP